MSLFLPVAFVLRGTWFYRRLVMTGGSVVVVSVALIWFVERVWNLRILTG